MATTPSVDPTVATYAAKMTSAPVPVVGSRLTPLTSVWPELVHAGASADDGWHLALAFGPLVLHAPSVRGQVRIRLLVNNVWKRQTGQTDGAVDEFGVPSARHGRKAPDPWLLHGSGQWMRSGAASPRLVPPVSRRRSPTSLCANQDVSFPIGRRFPSAPRLRPHAGPAEQPVVGAACGRALAPLRIDAELEVHPTVLELVDVEVARAPAERIQMQVS